MRNLDTLFIGRNFLDLPSVNSTNEYALNLLSKSKPPEGTVISTQNQYAGRGQIGSSWESEPDKNVAVSIILYPSFVSVSRQFLLNQCVSLAVFDLVEKYFPGKTAIKWPNDIYINEKKVAGILIQNAVAGTAIRHAIVGIGININQAFFTTSAPNATSFCTELGEESDVGKIVTELCHCLESRYLKLKAGNLVPLQNDYLQALYLYKTENLFQRPDGRIFSGIISGVAESGQLLVEIAGKTESFGLKEIKFLQS